MEGVLSFEFSNRGIQISLIFKKGKFHWFYCPMLILILFSSSFQTFLNSLIREVCHLHLGDFKVLGAGVLNLFFSIKKINVLIGQSFILINIMHN